MCDSGAIAGALAAFVTNPLDVAKTRIQTQCTSRLALESSQKTFGVKDSGFKRTSTPRTQPSVAMKHTASKPLPVVNPLSPGCCGETQACAVDDSGVLLRVLALGQFQTERDASVVIVVHR